MLLKFFSNSDTTGYLRGLATEFGESTNAIRLELERLKKAGLLNSAGRGRIIEYRANTRHPIFPELHSIALKNLGLNHIEGLIEQLGTVECAMVTGDYARGVDSGIIDVILVGDINRKNLDTLTRKAEGLLDRRIRTLVMNNETELDRYRETMQQNGMLLLWKQSEMR